MLAGAATESELKEKKARLEDALHATRAAIEEGIVVGGGVALLRCVSSLDGLKLKGDEATGAKIIREALCAPIRQIAANAGMQPGIVLHKVLSREGSFGYDAEADEYTDLIQAGVIDPTKVVRCALENGSSVARVLLSTDCCVAEKPEEKEEHGDEYGGEGMDMM